MGDWGVDENNGTHVDSVEQLMGIFIADAYRKSAELQQVLDADPMKFESIEQKVKELFDRGAGLFMTGLIAKSMKTKQHERRSQEARRNYVVPLRAGHDRRIRVHLGSGYGCNATTRYCGVQNPDENNSIPGLDIELSIFGFTSDKSPWLVSKICRTFALSNSLDLAWSELQREGIKLDKNVIDRIVTQAGKELLTLRERMLQQFEEGDMLPGKDFHGKRISVQVDGGRTRTRSEMEPISFEGNLGKTQSEVTGQPSQGRSKEKRRKGTFEATWREPKVFTIYVHDENGRKDPAFRTVIDGSFADADYAERLIAMQLYRYGAQEADSITFNSDGAAWIWDRIESIIRRAKIPTTIPIHKVLDVYHAAENLSKGIKALGEPHQAVSSDPTAVVSTELAEAMSVNGQAIKPIQYSTLRTMLRDGQWREVAQLLSDGMKYAINNKGFENAEVVRVVNYLRNHGEAGHLDYTKFSLLGLPLGSGSIESAIRRVVNLRLKGNGTFWRLAKAEGVLAIRSSVLCGKWDEDRLLAKQAMARDRRHSMPPIIETSRSKSDARLQTFETQQNA